MLDGGFDAAHPKADKINQHEKINRIITAIFIFLISSTDRIISVIDTYFESAIFKTSIILEAKWKRISLRTFLGISTISFSFHFGRISVLIPAR